jgi:hypothetical protein
VQLSFFLSDEFELQEVNERASAWFREIRSRLRPERRSVNATSTAVPRMLGIRERHVAAQQQKTKKFRVQGLLVSRL